MTAVSLDDRYGVDKGSVYLTGIQALVRMTIAQARRDRAHGLHTAGFVSGYRGSPLAGVDKAFVDARRHLEANDITLKPAINEEMAATILIGTQQAPLYPGATRQGVFGLFYGKGPGLDRAGDALKHANSLGSSAHGGVLVVAGDDHGAVSSSMAHQSEQLMMSWMMPVLNPASVRDYIELGLYGWAMSRFSGCWIGFKAVTETVESACTLDVDPDHPRIVLPQDFAPPPGGLHIRFPDTQLAQEERLHRFRLPAAQAFARANRLDRIVLDSPRPRLGIVATGKAWLDLRQALQDLGLDDAAAARLGLRLYKVAMPWPLEPEGALAFAAGLEKVLVVEEKRGVIEPQLKELLYHLPADRRPAICGKTDARGRPLIPTMGEIDPELVAKVLVGLVDAPADLADGFRDRLAFVADKSEERAAATLAVRQPYFCSGCPHNTSTKVPEGHHAFAGTGCHLMALWMGRDTSSILHMGAEGANWIGVAPFTSMEHVFQNLGDGTYVHSGAIAIRQAVAAGATMTYKILFNDAVAMTGGQPIDGGLTVRRLVQQLHHEGVRAIAIVSDAPEKYADITLPASVHGRRDYEAVQRRMAAEPGVTAIIYDQMCAAEKRRRLRRAKQAATRRPVINTGVCENCNDCVAVANCLALKPVPTPLGTKKAVDQSACNTDFACVEALCPAFVTVEGTMRKPQAATWTDRLLPVPRLPALDRPFGILITGIGGTGVVTIGQILGWAALIEGRQASVLDFTGLSQKGGGVLTHVRLAPSAEMLHAARLNVGAADVVVAGDLVVTAGVQPLAHMRRGHTRIVGNDDLAPTAASLKGAALDDAEQYRRILRGAVGDTATDFVAAAALAEALLGDTLYTNVFLLGFAWQKGLLPLGLDALQHAIRLNGREVAENARAFAWGRLAAHDPAAARTAAGLAADVVEEETLDALVARRTAYLVDYQDEAYAARYRAVIDRAAAAESRVWGAHRQELTAAVARGYFRVLAYKDEYEVARLLTSRDFAAQLERLFEPGFRPTIHVASPFDRAGRPHKKPFGPWAQPALRLLARMKMLRGTAFDPFGRMAERRAERQLLAEYESVMAGVFARLSTDNHAAAVEIAALPEEIRGFGSVKQAAMERARRRQAELLSKFEEPSRRKVAAE